MACEQYHLTVYSERVPLSPPYRDHGCPGDTRKLTTSTNLPPGVTYKWQIDGGPIVSTKSWYNYTHDNKYHAVTVTASSGGCEMVTKINMHGRDCTQCTIGCITQSTTFSAGTTLWLTDEQNRRYVIEPGMLAVCRAGSNIVIAAAIKKAILSQSTCENDNLRVSVYYNQSGRNCLTLTISNSPVRFRYFRVDGVEYAFDKTKC